MQTSQIVPKNSLGPAGLSQFLSIVYLIFIGGFQILVAAFLLLIGILFLDRTPFYWQNPEEHSTRQRNY
jgi:hypothetical protein